MSEVSKPKSAPRPPAKVLVAGELWLSCTGRSIADGLRALGCDVGEVDSRYFVAVWRSLPLRVAARLTRHLMRDEYLAAITRQLETVRPELFLAIKGSHLDRSIFETCRRLGIASAVYYPDYHFDYKDVALPELLFADHFATTKSFQVDYLKAQSRVADIHLVHHGHAPSHAPALAKVDEDEFARDVAYIGTYTPYKERWLGEVARLLPNVTFEIFGEDWQRATDPEVIKRCRGPRYAGAYAETLQTSRINIALHMESQGEHGWADKVSIRTFEIPACKGFMLHVDNDEIRTLYDVGSEIDVFQAPADLAEKIKAYLAEPGRRAAMVEAAYRRCVPAYSYRKRAEELLTIAAGPPGRPAAAQLPTER